MNQPELTPAEKFLAMAQAAQAKKRYKWTQFFEATAIYRSRLWKWCDIYAKLVEAGAAPAGDPKALRSFRTTMSLRISKAEAKLKAVGTKGRI